MAFIVSDGSFFTISCDYINAGVPGDQYQIVEADSLDHESLRVKTQGYQIAPHEKRFLLPIDGESLPQTGSMEPGIAYGRLVLHRLNAIKTSGTALANSAQLSYIAFLCKSFLRFAPSFSMCLSHRSAVNSAGCRCPEAVRKNARTLSHMRAPHVML